MPAKKGHLKLMTYGEYTTLHCTGRNQNELSKHTTALMARYREENKRLKEINSDMYEALKELIAWFEDPDNEEQNATILNVERILAKAEGKDQ